MKNIWRVSKYVPGLGKLILFMTTVSVIQAVTYGSQPYAFKVLVDELAGVNGALPNQDTVLFVLSGLFVLRIVSSALNYGTNLMSNRAYTNIMLGLRVSVFERLTKLSIDYFEKTRHGEIMTRASGNTTDVALWFYNAGGMVLGQLLTVMFALVMICLTDWRAGALIVVVMAVFYAQQFPMLRKTRPIGRESNKAMERSGGYLSETVSHIATVRSFGGEQGALTQFRRELNEWRDLDYKRLAVRPANY